MHLCWSDLKSLEKKAWRTRFLASVPIRRETLDIPSRQGGSADRLFDVVDVTIDSLSGAA
jgi:hypothetical protein